eukprot:evm.model.scf_1121.1 EVM.evm.TU.scf_1121.1   scf_1121:12664-15097(+)
MEDESTATSAASGVGPAVRLDVGGTRFTVTKASIDRFPYSLLAGLVEGCPDALTREDPLHVDRDPRGFEVVHKIYRTGKFDANDVKPPYTLEAFTDDLKYYGLPCWNEIIATMDNRFLRLLTEEKLQAVVHAMQSEIVDMETSKFLENEASFVLYSKEAKDISVLRFDLSKLAAQPTRPSAANAPASPTLAPVVRLEGKSYCVANLGDTSKAVLKELFDRMSIRSTIILQPLEIVNARTKSHVQCQVIKLEW